MRSYLAFIRRHWPMLAFGFLTVFWGNFGQSFFVSWYGKPIQEDLGLSATTYGGAYSLATLASGLSIFWLGGLVDRWPLRRFVTAVTFGLAAAAGLLASARNLPTLVAGFFLLRLCGQGLLPHTGLTAMARHFSVNRGKALSLAGCGIPAGEVVLPGLAVAAIAALGWRGSWPLVAASALFVYLPLAWWLLGRAGEPEPPVGTGGGQGGDGGGRRQVLGDGRFWLALPALLAGPFIVTGVFIHQGFVLEQKGWSAALFAACFALYGLVHWLASLATGWLVDRFGAARLLPALALPAAVGLLVAAMADGAWVAAVLMAGLAATIGAGLPIGGALWAEIYGLRHIGAIRAMTASIVVLSTAAAPVLLGALIDAGVGGRSLLAALAAYAGLAALLASRSYPRRSR